MLLKIILLFFTLAFAQPSGNNWWNGIYYNVSVSAAPGYVVNIDWVTLYTDWFDLNLNDTAPAQIKVLYRVQQNNPLTYYSINVTLNAYIGIAQEYIAFGNNLGWNLFIMPDFGPSFCSQSGVGYTFCPYWAPLHFLSGSTRAFGCVGGKPRCEIFKLDWSFLGSPSVPYQPSYPMIRGNARCSGASTYQGQGGNSRTYKQLAATNQLFGIKFTANATGTIKRFCLAYASNVVPYFALYADNTLTPVGGALLANSPPLGNIGPTNNIPRVIWQQDNNYLCQNNVYNPTLSITSGTAYWLVAYFTSTTASIPWVSGGCAALSSYTSTAGIGNQNSPPLIGPAGTVSNDCYFMYVETC
jgi:hypothetical protein